jgi:hypothetical protein
MRISRDGARIRWVSADGNTGTASITAPVAQASVMLPLPRVFSRRIADAAAPAPTAAEPPHQETATTVAPPPAAGKDATDQTKSAPSFVHAPVAVAVATPPPRATETRTQPPAPRQTEPRRPAPPLFMVANVRADDVLNVRSGPSADFDIVGELPPGSRGIAITDACRARWCPVRHLSATGWVNSAFLAPEPSPAPTALITASVNRPVRTSASPVLRDSPEAPRNCLTRAAHALLDRIEQRFGPVQVISTCRPGAVIAGTNHPSRHATGNAIDFNAGPRKGEIVAWLIANHHAGGTMTYTGMNHIHVDIGPHFVSIAGGRHWASWREHRHAGGRGRDSDDEDDN